MLQALDVSGERVGTSFVVAALVGIGVGVVLGFDFPPGLAALGDAVARPYRPGDADRAARGRRSAALVGHPRLPGRHPRRDQARPSAASWSRRSRRHHRLDRRDASGQVGAALGVLVALITWPILAGLDVARAGIDTEALGNKFKPDETINLTKETIEWVRARTPLVPKS